MKFYQVTSIEPDVAVLTADHQSGREIGSIRLGKTYLFFKEKRKVYYIPYADIRRVFRRVVLVQARMCCGKGNLEVENLVVCGDSGELAQIQVPGARAGKILLEELSKLAPHAQIGKPKENNDGNPL